ncbi:hypothetical protein [Ornithinimicrobium kibberense]|uniref:hypothetical protein n=1 Tax=Ornithinimicrobium kibberense TaxID=282060 RepID=UPI00361CB6F8
MACWAGWARTRPGAPRCRRWSCSPRWARSPWACSRRWPTSWPTAPACAARTDRQPQAPSASPRLIASAKASTGWAPATP